MNSYLLDVPKDGVAIRCDPDSVACVDEPVYLDHTTDDELRLLTIYLASDLQPGASYVLDLTFSGVMNTDNTGLYATSYTSSGGEDK